MKTQILKSPDISCDHCERTVKQALGEVPGVHEVEVDIPAQEIRLAYDETRVEQSTMEAVLSRAGYPVAGKEGKAMSQPKGGPCCGSCHL